MSCGGSGKIAEKVERYATHPMIRTVDCPGCHKCRPEYIMPSPCPDCFKGKGHYCTGREGKWVKYPYLICSMCTVGKTVDCPTCNGSGLRRKG